MQIKVLVAEDEAPILRSICANIERTNPLFKVVARAENGKRALEAMRETEGIGLVFLDINMPVLNGVEVLKELKKEYPDVFVVILSGYQDFSYAKAALQNGAVEYLLKPLKTAELKETLETVEKKFTQRRQFRVAKLVQDPPFREISNLPMIKPAFVACLTIGSFVMHPGSAKITAEHIETEKILRGILDETYGAEHYTLATHEHYMAQILIVDENVGTPWEPLEMFLMEQGETAFPLPVTVVSYPRPVEVKNIPETHYALRTLLWRDMPFGKNAFINYPLGAQVEDLQVAPTDYINTFSCITANFSKDEAFAVYKQAFENGEKTRTQVLQMTKSFFSEVLSFPQRAKNYFFIEREIIYAVEESFNKEELYSRVEELLKQNWGEVHTEVFSKTDIAKSVEQYLLANLEQQISLELLEKKFGYTGSYIRELFRAEVGISPLEYLLNERISRAKQLLLSGMSAKNVAMAVGFLDPLYFSKVFKKHTGISPSLYKER